MRSRRLQLLDPLVIGGLADPNGSADSQRLGASTFPLHFVKQLAADAVLGADVVYSVCLGHLVVLRWKKKSPAATNEGRGRVSFGLEVRLSS